MRWRPELEKDGANSVGLAIDVAVAKTNRYASRESGDTAEFVERPGGGLSVVVADGQGSGRGAKALSLQVTAKAVALLKDGVRDGAVARATHDALFASRFGQVSATLDILSVDLATRSVVITRNAETPLIVGQAGVYEPSSATSGPIGHRRFTRPSIVELPVAASLQIVLMTDGIAHAGAVGMAAPWDLAGFAATAFAPDDAAATLADRLLAEAIRRDHGRPRDDMTVVALALRPHTETTLIRRMAVSLPLP